MTEQKDGDPIPSSSVPALAGLYRTNKNGTLT